MNCRTAFSFDRNTIRRLKNLAARWQVSQAEVVRRAVAQAENQPAMEKSDPVAMLKALHATGQGLSRETADAYLSQVYADRKHWRGE